jgi:hypothetical protein
LTLHYEEPHMLVLSKTGKTVKVDEFLVPQAPSLKQPVEVKRRRRTPPPTVTEDATGLVRFVKTRTFFIFWGTGKLIFLNKNLVMVYQIHVKTNRN